jgi:hypothetical protein
VFALTGRNTLISMENQIASKKFKKTSALGMDRSVHVKKAQSIWWPSPFKMGKNKEEMSSPVLFAAKGPKMREE